MIKRKTALKFRKTHRYLGLFLGLQFLMWTISGIYFSWTDINEIHGDHFKRTKPKKSVFQNLLGTDQLNFKQPIHSLELVEICYRYMLSELKISRIELIENVDEHHEYRGRPLPAYEISYDTYKNLKAYIAVNNGAFQTVRYRDWRWFDFLWMTHTMDYQGRDNFNTIVLRGFSLLGLITVCSGFLLWFVSSPTLRKIKKRI